MKYNNLIVAITGASGAIYGKRLVEELNIKNFFVNLIISHPAELVIKNELKINLKKLSLSQKIQFFFNKNIKNIKIFDIDDISSTLASGSFSHQGMIIAPCSCKTLGAIASGISFNLIERAADVCLKQKKPLILLLRETPLNQIHLKNMMVLSQAGAIIMPASPAFYHYPKTIEDQINFIIGKILDILNIENNLYKKWKENEF
ncbi:MAG: flavin prenyltransferase UbiX [bacterium]